MKQVAVPGVFDVCAILAVTHLGSEYRFVKESLGDFVVSGLGGGVESCAGEDEFSCVFCSVDFPLPVFFLRGVEEPVGKGPMGPFAGEKERCIGGPLGMVGGPGGHAEAGGVVQDGSLGVESFDFHDVAVFGSDE